MAKAPKVRSAARVKSKDNGKGKKVSTRLALTIPAEIVPQLVGVLGWLLGVVQKEKPKTAAPATCCGDVCKDVPDGKKRLVVCDGKTMTAWAGTADGQYPKWDQNANTWVLANV